MQTHLSVQHDVSLRAHNTFGIEARAAAYLRVEQPEMLAQVRRDPLLSHLPRLVLGGGSNVLLSRDFPGLVLHMATRGIARVGETDDAVLVKVAAGESWHALVLWTLAQGLPGLENLSLIPGSAGAAPIQNIGAYGIELKDRFHALTVFDFDTGNLRSIGAQECGFGYRDSVFKHALRDRAVIVDVTLSLPKRWQANASYADLASELAGRGITNPTAVQISDAVIAVRRRKLPDPAEVGNAGSFFKNPLVSAQQRQALLDQFPQLVSYVQADGSYKLAAGWLIDQCGWKGRREGAAGVYDKQALVLVNWGGATGADLVQLARQISADVKSRFGVELEPEPVII